MCPGRPAARARMSRADSFDAVPGPEQDRRVEVPLDGAILAGELPALVEGDAPVEADHVAAGVGHRREQRDRAGAEVDRRHAGLAQRGEDVGRPGRGELGVVGG